MFVVVLCVFFNDRGTTGIYTYVTTLSLPDALPVCRAPSFRLEQVPIEQRLHAVAPALVGVAADADAGLLQQPAAFGIAHRDRDVEDKGRDLVDVASDRLRGAELARQLPLAAAAAIAGR